MAYFDPGFKKKGGHEGPPFSLFFPECYFLAGKSRSWFSERVVLFEADTKIDDQAANDQNPLHRAHS